MSDMVYKTVDCLRGYQIIASYQLSYANTIPPSIPPDLIEEAKEFLVREGLVKPPPDFAGIVFNVRDGW